MRGFVTLICGCIGSLREGETLRKKKKGRKNMSAGVSFFRSRPLKQTHKGLKPILFHPPPLLLLLLSVIVIWCVSSPLVKVKTQTDTPVFLLFLSLALSLSYLFLFFEYVRRCRKLDLCSCSSVCVPA